MFVGFMFSSDAGETSEDCLRELWGDEPLPPPPPVRIRSAPCHTGALGWSSRRRRASQRRVMKERAYKGLSLPAHRFSEFSSPPTSPWWSPEILRLRHEAEDEEREIKHSFALRHRPRYRVLADPEFRADRDLLHALLGRYYAADAARIAAGPGQAALAAKEYTLSILTHDFLAAWVDRPLPEVALWAHRTILAFLSSGITVTVAGGRHHRRRMGVAAVWGDDGAAYGSGSAAAWGDGAAPLGVPWPPFPIPPPSGIGGGPRSTVIAHGAVFRWLPRVWAGEKDDSGGDLPGCAASSAPTRNLYVNSCYFST
ncbi:hypothetical protein K438DRAFT_2004839 [Mycena galopus ATCC 62051]|nr:hypothetical protein K438DRAFT_2004839 [Mycena galopus ATCC 62051]